MVVMKSMSLHPEIATGDYIPTVSTCLKLKHACKEEGPVSGRRPVNPQAALSERHPSPRDLNRVPFITLTR